MKDDKDIHCLTCSHLGKDEKAYPCLINEGGGKFRTCIMVLGQGKTQRTIYSNWKKP